eukprot:6492784-Pyramimonas_sp.AAC.1
MTKQERIVHTMKELHSAVHTADVTTALQMIRAAGRQREGEGARSTHVREGATSSQDRALGATPAPSPT